MGSNPVFPNLYNFAISHVIDMINISTSRKKLFFKLPYTKKSYRFLPILKKINFISNYFLFTFKNKIWIALVPFYYKHLRVIKNFSLLSRPSRFYYISLKALLLLHGRTGDSTYLLSTSQGVFRHQDAIKKKLSGFLIGFFHN